VRRRVLAVFTRLTLRCPHCGKRSRHYRPP
jgi:endogenous inhibitor of DNA gyrase (YacG/DUF329 family)